MTTINHPTSFETFTDYNGNQIKFQLTFLNLGDKFCVAADEVTDDLSARTFNAYDCEFMEAALTKVRKLIKDELNTMYFTENDGDPFDEMNLKYFRGHISEMEDGAACLVVDGKIMSMVNFEKYLMDLTGSWIEVKILD